MTDEKAAELTPVREMTEEEKQALQKKEAIEGTEKSVLMLKRIHDLLTVGLFQGANATIAAESQRFCRHLIAEAEGQLAALKPEGEAADAPKPDVKQDSEEPKA